MLYLPRAEELARMTTDEVRASFLIADIFRPGELTLHALDLDRVVLGGAVPTSSPLRLETTEELAAEYFTERREVGVLSAPPSDPAVATVTPDGTPAAPKPRPKRPQSQDGVAQLDPRAIPPGFAVRQRHPSPGRDGFIRPPPNAGSPGFSFGNLFSRW